MQETWVSPRPLAAAWASHVGSKQAVVASVVTTLRGAAAQKSALHLALDEADEGPAEEQPPLWPAGLPLTWDSGLGAPHFPGSQAGDHTCSNSMVMPGGRLQ